MTTRHPEPPPSARQDAIDDGLLRDDELEYVVGGLDRPLELPRELVRAPHDPLRLGLGA
jgi:hypothetical protein